MTVRVRPWTAFGGTFSLVLSLVLTAVGHSPAVAARGLVAAAASSTLTVTINQSAGQADPTNAPSISFTAIFSAPVSGFTAADVTLNNSTAPGPLTANVSGSGATYTVSVSGMTGSGTVVARIPAGAAQDAAGNFNQSSTATDNSVRFENVAPTVTVNQSAFQADPTKASLISYTVKFSEPVTGFTASDVSFAGTTAGGSLTAFLTGSGSSYNLSVGGMISPGIVMVSVRAGAARDAANNSNLASTSTDNSVTWYAPGPTVTINQDASQPDPTNASSIVFNAVFSTSVTGFDGSDINFTGSSVGGVLEAQVSGTGSTYRVAVSGMTSPGMVVVNIPAGAAKDASNHGSLASTSTDNSVAFDNAPPSVTINQAAGQADPANTTPILFTVVFSEPVVGFGPDDVSFAGSTAGTGLTAGVTGGGQVYTVSVTGMTSSGSVVASIPAGAATDAVGNGSTASTSTDHSVTYSAATTVTINQASTQADPTKTSPVLFSVVFSAPVTGFDGSDISFTGSTVGGALVASVTGTGANYTVSVSGMNGAGSVIATVVAGAAIDAASRPNLISTSADNVVTFDNVAPTVTINKAAGQSDPAATSPLLFTVTFSEAVTGFTAGDVSFGGSTVSGSLVASVTGSGANYTVSVSGMSTPGDVVATIPAGAAQDSAVNGSQASTSVDNIVAYDNVPPTVTINQSGAQPDPTNASPVVFSVVFSEAVSGFTAADVSLAGSTAGGALTASVTGSGASYTVSVTGMTTTGVVVASIPAGAAQDTAGSSNLASTSSDNVVTFDNTVPAVTIDQAAGQLDPTGASPITFTVVFSEPVTGFTADDVTFTDSTVGGALHASVIDNGTSYSVRVTGMSGTGTVVARIAAGAASDGAGNPSAASTSTDNSVTYMPSGPTVTITQTAAQADPANTSPILFNVVFSAAVTGFDGSDISFAGTTAPGALTANVTGSGTTYLVSVSGMTGAGTVVASIGAGAAIDAANNPNQASTSADNRVTFDNVSPTVTINQGAAQSDPTGGSPIVFTVAFSEPVSGFTAGDVSLSGSTAGGTLAAVVTGSGASYSVGVTGMTTPGTVVASIVAGAATDAAGNTSAASTSADNSVTFDNLPPGVTINQAAAQSDPGTVAPLQFTVTFSEPVSGFTGTDVSFAGSSIAGTLAASILGTGPTYTVSVTGMTGSGTVVVSIPAGAATDSAGNPSTASTSVDNSVAYAPLGPTVTINQAAGPVGRSGQADPTNGSPIVFTVVFSAPVTGFDGSDVDFTGSTVNGSLAASVTGSGQAYSVAVTGMSGNGTVVAHIPAGAAVDSGGAPTRASTSTDNSVTFDTLAPTVTIEQASGQSDPTNASPILFTVTFSEPVIGFTSTDVSLAGSTVGGTQVVSVTGSGANYIVSVTGMSGTGTLVATIPAGAAKDAASNNNSASTSVDNTVTFNPTGPTVTINQAAGQADPTNASPVLFTVVFSTAVTGFTGTDINLSASTVGGTLTPVVTGNGTTYTVSVTGMTGAGNIVATIPAGAAIDSLATPSAASTSIDNTVTFDNVAPTVTINQAAGQADPTNASPILFSVVFSEAVTGFATGDVSLAGSTVGGTLVASVSGSGANYTVSVTGMSGTGTVVASIPASAAVDLANNPSAASTSTDNTVTYTTTGPSVTINQAAAQPDPTNVSPVTFTVVFSAPVTGFTGSDVNFAGSTVGGTLIANVTGTGTTYTVSVTGMTGAGTVIASIPAGAAQDGAANPNQASTSTDNTITFDNVAPTVTINQASGQADPTNASPIQFSVVFSEAVTGFATGDVSLAGSTVGGTLVANVSGGGTTYTVSVTGMSGNGTVVASIPAGGAQDAAGNLNTASTSTDNTVTHTVIGPTVTINQATGQADPTNTSPIQFTVVFSAPVTDFTAADVDLTSHSTLTGLVANVTGSGANYTVTVTGMNGTGAVIANIQAGAATDAAGNPSLPSSSADNVVTFDNVAPTVTINQAPAQVDPTNVSPIVFNVVFSEPVTGFATGDVVTTGSTVSGTLVANVSGSGANYTVSVSGMTGTGTVIATIPAAAASDTTGNPNVASTSTDNSVTFNATAPTVTINQAATQTDPTNSSAIGFTVVFSAPVTGFTGTDVNLTGSTAPGTLLANVTGSGANYTVTITGMTAPGTVVATIPAGAAQDAATNSSQASTSTDNTVTFDDVAPTATIDQALGQSDPTNASPILFSVVFSEPVIGFTGSDVSFAGSTVGGTLVANISGSGANYTVSVSGMSGTGTVIASIPAGAVTDLATNPNTASTSTDNTVTYNTTTPTVTINQAAGQADPTNTAPVLFTAVFSAPVSGFTGSDVVFTGSTAPGTLAASVSGSATTYTVSVSGMTGAGTVVASIPAGAAQDAAANLNQASTSTDNTVSFDNVAPTVTINQASGQSDPTNGSSIVFTVVFSEAVTGFTGGDVSFTGSTIGGTLAANVSGSGANYTVSVTGMSGTGTVIASIPAGAATDLATNPSAPSTSTDNTVTYNSTAPSVTINQAAGQADPTNGSPVLFTVVFSTSVTGFTGSDVSLAGSTAPGTLAASVSGSGTTYTVSVSGMAGPGTVVATIPAGAAQDAATNLSQASTSTDNTVTFDNVAPTVTINQASGQADPSNSTPILFTVVFSEPVSGFTGSDVSFAGSTAGGVLAALVSGSGANYTVSVSGMSATGTVVASIPAGAATDNATNPSAASTSTDNTVTYNVTPVTVTINRAAGQADPTSVAPIVFAAFFSVPVTGFTASDVSLTGTTAPGAIVNVSGGGANYTVSVSGMTGSGTVVVSIPAGVATDSAGNPNQASTSTDNSIDYDVTGPRVTSASPSGNTPGPVDRITLTFSEPIRTSTFTLADVVSLTGPGGALTATAVNALNSQQFEVLFPAQTSGTFTLVIGPDIFDLVTNPMDQNANGVNGETTADRYSTSFTIAGSAALLSVTPQSGQQGQTNLNVVVAGQFTNFVNGVTTAGFSGTGISVNSVTVTNPTSVTLNVDISPIAVPNQRTVTVTTNAEVVSSSVTGTFFTVTPSPAAVASVSPNHGSQGETLSVNITGFVTHFANGSTSVSFGNGVSVNSIVVNSPTSLAANITIQPTAATGSRDVIVTTAGETATGVGAFTVDQAPPRVTSVSPATGHQAETLSVVVNAQFTHFDGTTTADFGPGIAVSSVAPTSATTATVSISIDRDASPGSRTVVMHTGLESAQQVGAFTVLSGIPALQSITPVAGTQGTNATLILNGAFTHFTQGLTFASLGSGIIAGTVTVNGPELASVPITITDGAVVGPRNVTVSTGTESVTLFNGFNVIQGSPAVTIIDPNAAQRGTTQNVTLVGHFTNWQNGITHVSYGAGVTVNSNVVSSATQVTTNITIEPAATLAPRDVVVTTGTEIETVYGGFTVNDVDVTAPAVLTYSPSYGTINVPLNAVPTVEWNEPLNRSTVNTDSFKLYDAFTGQFVSGTVTLDATGRIVAFVPGQLLAVNRTYYLYVGYYGQVRDVAGNAYSGTSVYFVTGFTTDTTGPTLLRANPADGDTGVAVNGTISLQFDRPINAASRALGLQILKAGVPVAGIFTFTDALRQINFAPAVPWEPNTTYTIALTSGLIGIAGNSLTNPGNRSFTAGTDPDTTAPQVVSYSPGYGDVNVGLRPIIRVVFSERVNPITINSTNFYLYNNNLGVYVPTVLAIAADRLSATLTPVDDLNPFTAYFFQLYNVQDVAGNYGGGATVYFTTGASLDSSAPTVVSVTPSNGATNVPVNALVRVTTDEQLDPTSIDNTTLHVTPPAAGSVSLLGDQRTLRLALNDSLTPSTTYTIHVSGARDLSGNPMAPFSSSFTTSASAVLDTTAPTVVSFTPVAASTNVPVTTPIVMTLSEPIDPAQVGPNSMRVYVSSGSVQIAGTYTVSNRGTVVTFTPLAAYPAGTNVFAYSNYDGSLTDLAGNMLQSTSTSFTTAGSQPDTTAPTIVSVTPANGAVGVGPQAVITLTFSESMNPATNDYQNFAVFAGGVQQSIGISRTADNRMVLLSGTWPLNTVMSVVATGDNTDLSGNYLAPPFSSTFTTAAAFDPSRPSIVTQLPIGSNVARTSPITLYSNKALNAATVQAALYVSQDGILVDGTVTVSGNGTAINFTPAAPFASNAVIQVFVTADAEDTFGNQMNPYAGSFTVAADPATSAPVVIRTSPVMASVDNPLNSIIEVEFSEPLDPATVSAANVSVYLLNANPPIAGTLSLLNGNRTIRFVPDAPLQAGAYYYVYLMAGLHDAQGTPLTFINYYFYVGSATDTTTPAIVSIAPANGFTNVGINASIRVQFNEPINALSVTPASVTLSSPAGPVPVTFVFSTNNTSLRIVPQNPLPPNTVMTLSIDPSDIAGNELPAVQSRFTTGAAADTTAPSVATASWTYSQIVPVNSVFEFVFSEPMDAPTVLAQQATFLTDGRFGGYAAGTLTASADARTFTFTPSSPLAVSRPYSIQLYGGFDLAGNLMSGFTSYVTTDFLSDTVAPAVLQVNPVAGGTGAPRNAKIRVLFSEPIAVDTASNVRLLQNGNPLPASLTLTNENRLVTLTPNALLASSTVFTISVAQVRDTSANLQSSAFTSTFTTGNDVDLIAPVVATYSSYYGQLVPRNVVVRVTFSEPIDPITINSGNFYLYNGAGQPAVPALISISGDRRSATLTPTSPLLPNSQYYAQLSSYSDSAGNPGSGVSVYLLTTNAIDENAPAVASITPANGAGAVPVNARVVVVMNEAVDVTSVTNNVIRLTPSVPGTVSLSLDQTTLTFTPSTPLSTSTSYAVQVSGLRDLAVQTMAPFSSGFTTSASSAADTTAPTVLSMSPVNGAAGVAVNSSLTFTTSEPITRSAVGPAANPVFAYLPTFGSVQIAGTYAVDTTNTIVTFTPLSPYPANTTIFWYTNYNGLITDLAGNSLQSLSPQFITGSSADVTAPTLVSVTPADGATDLGPLTPITLTFSESMSPASDYNNIALFNGSTRVNASIYRSNDNRMVFISAGLSPETTYTIVATSGIQDLSGNAFAGFSSSFTTAAFDVSRPSIVTQRPTGSGATPGTSITLFADSALDSSTVAAATFVSQNGFLVPGTVTVSGSGRTIVFTPSAPFAPGTTVEIAVTANATDPSRNPLYPYYGAFTVATDPATSAPVLLQTSPLQTSVNNPLNSQIDLEFSEPLNPATITPTTFAVYLFNANPPVTGTVSLINGNRTIHFVPDNPLQAGAYYYVYATTGIQDVQGTAFGGTSYYFYLGDASDSTNPAVTSLTPSNGSTGIGINAVAVIRFSEPVNPVTVNTTTIALTAGSAIPFVLSRTADLRTYYVTSQLPLPASTTITFSVNGVKDIAGNVAPAATASFTTGTAPDTVHPSVAAFSLAYNDTNVPVNVVPQMLFDEPVDPGSISTDVNSYLYDTTIGYIAGGTVSLSPDGRVLTFVPPANLAPGRQYVFAGPSTVLDLAGNPLNYNYVYFTTSSSTDTTAPSVVAVSPPALSGVPRNALIEVVFDEPVRQTALTQVNVLVAGSPLPVAARTLSNGNRTLTITLAGLMSANMVHTISIAGVRDVAGNTMPTLTSSFTTGSQSDLIAPSATVTFAPANGATGVPVNIIPSVTFNEPVSPAHAITVGSQNIGVFMYQPAIGQYVAVTYSFSADYKTIMVTPTAPLQAGTQYQLIVYYGITDLAGNSYPSYNYISFTTQ
jgi:hypothetical protein